MTGQIVEIVCGNGHCDSVRSSAEQNGAVLLSEILGEDEETRANMRVLVPAENLQAFLDRLQTQLPPESQPLILVQSVQAELPGRDLQGERSEGRGGGLRATREELYAAIQKGTNLDLNFVVLVVLATIVAAIGLAEDNVAVIIAAMVIAPLLGPNLGLALGAALGDTGLIKRSVATNAVGVLLTIGLSASIVQVWPVDLGSYEIVSRTEVRPSSVVLAFAAGVAAVLSLTTRLASVLVGVMVAVALVPPAAAAGMLLGAGELTAARGALLLLAVNVVAVNLAAQLVFVVRRIRPRSWYERQEARQSTLINASIWALLLALAGGLMWWSAS